MAQHWLHQQISFSNHSKIGLIDIGSNSVRLVVYDRLKRAPASIYNEKVMCQLGRGLASSGKLNPEGVVMAKEAIARFVALAKNMEVTELNIIATAAVREASDGEAFVEELEKKHRIFIEVISGKREAKLGAFGILSAIHKPQGLVCDLGGGSLELVTIDADQEITQRASLPIGALRLIDECEDAKTMRRKAVKALDNLDWLDDTPLNLYAIGGSFRNIARMHYNVAQYALALTHNYQTSAKSLAPILQKISESDELQLAMIPGISPKRTQLLPAAAIVLDELIKRTKPKEVIFSESGIREGYLFEKLSPFIREEDGLIASCIEMSERMQQSLAYGRELYEWMQPFLKGQPDDQQRLAYACCLLQDIASYINPDDRARWSYERIIESNFHGLNHVQRVQLALALYYRYRYKPKDMFKELELLSDKEKYWAHVIGTIASLAHHLTGGVAGALPHISLNINPLQIILPNDMKALMGPIIEKRLKTIGTAFQMWQMN